VPNIAHLNKDQTYKEKQSFYEKSCYEPSDDSKPENNQVTNKFDDKGN